jgi:hypothetical protein
VKLNYDWSSGDWAMHLPTLLEFLANNMAVIPHPPYSPDLPPCDFLLLPIFKMALKGRRFNDASKTGGCTCQVSNN